METGLHFGEHLGASFILIRFEKYEYMNMNDLSKTISIEN